MALMTSCPACNTRFKVVQDQLQLHHGLVRCGACDHVFDANDRLESLPEPFKPNLGDTHLRGGFYDTADQSEGWINKPAVQALTEEPNKEEAPLTGWTQLLPAQNGLLPGATVESNTRPPPTPAARRHRIKADLSGSTAIITSQNAADEITLNAPSPSEFDTQQDPSAQALVKQEARRKRRSEKKRIAELEGLKQALINQKKTAANAPSASINWSKTMNAAGATLCALALSAALLQTTFAARYILADKFVVLKPLLSQLCATLSCSVEPATWLSPLTLDALSLSISNGSASNAESKAYRMQATVRNGSQLSVKTPDIELTISNAQGNPIARKVVTAEQLGAAPILSPNSDWQIDSAFMLDSQTVGYTARLVY